MNHADNYGIAIYSKYFEDGENCGGCGCETSVLYYLATNEIIAEGLCAYCFLEMIEKNGWEIIMADKV